MVVLISRPLLPAIKLRSCSVTFSTFIEHVVGVMRWQIYQSRDLKHQSHLELSTAFAGERVGK